MGCKLTVHFHSKALLHKASFHRPPLAAHDSPRESTLFTGFHFPLETPQSSSFVQRSCSWFSRLVMYSITNAGVCMTETLSYPSDKSCRRSRKHLVYLWCHSFMKSAVCYSCVCLISERFLHVERVSQVRHFSMLSSKGLFERGTVALGQKTWENVFETGFLRMLS